MAAMRAASLLHVTVLVAAIAVAGCKKSSGPASSGGAGGTTTATAPATLPIGMTDPFAPPKNDAAKLTDTAYAALKQKKAPVAIAALQNVVGDTPDWSPTRWALVRALVMGERYDDALKQWEELLPRDFFAAAGK